MASLTVVDAYCNEALATDVAGSIRVPRLTEVLSGLIGVRGAPRFLRSDKGQEFVSPGAAALDQRGADPLGGHRAGQAPAEWLQRDLQQQVTGRVPEPRVVPPPDRGDGRDRNLPSGLQRSRVALMRGAPAPEPVHRKEFNQDACKGQSFNDSSSGECSEVSLLLTSAKGSRVPSDRS